jgi:hypothetical protein
MIKPDIILQQSVDEFQLTIPQLERSKDPLSEYKKELVMRQFPNL